MPLQKIEWSRQECGWALWHITEAEADLILLSGSQQPPSDITNPTKRLEWLAGKLLLKAMLEETGLNFKGVYKDEYGRPYLQEQPHHISLSHSFPYVAAQIDKMHPVGIDIEQPKEKLLRIAPRIFSVTECADAGNDLIKNCIYWCAKEALYKIHGTRGLTFSEHLRVDPFQLSNEGNLIGRINFENKKTEHVLRFFLSEGFVLVVTN